jgi:hypothetical protein
MPGGASIVVVVAVAVLVTGCAGGSVTYVGRARGDSMALVVQHSGRASLTAKLKADSVLINVSARLGLQELVVFCAPSVDGASDRHVAVTNTGTPGEEGYPTSFEIDDGFVPSLPQAHDYVCGFRIRRPKGVSSTSYARLRASYVHGALLALRLSRR